MQLPVFYMDDGISDLHNLVNTITLGKTGSQMMISWSLDKKKDMTSLWSFTSFRLTVDIKRYGKNIVNAQWCKGYFYHFDWTLDPNIVELRW